MLVVIIGQSGSGKTTLAKERYLKGDGELALKPIAHTLFGPVLAMGKYGVGIRTEGTDTLSYNAIPKIIEFVDENYRLRETIVLEGDRINNKRFFTHCKMKGYQVKLILVKCSLPTSLRRLRAAGSKITIPFIKTTRTKSLNNFIKYSPGWEAELVNTEETECAEL